MTVLVIVISKVLDGQSFKNDNDVATVNQIKIVKNWQKTRPTKNNWCFWQYIQEKETLLTRHICLVLNYCESLTCRIETLPSDCEKRGCCIGIPCPGIGLGCLKLAGIGSHSDQMSRHSRLFCLRYRMTLGNAGWARRTDSSLVAGGELVVSLGNPGDEIGKTCSYDPAGSRMIDVVGHNPECAFPTSSAVQHSCQI